MYDVDDEMVPGETWGRPFDYLDDVDALIERRGFVSGKVVA